nr:hypothetical protein [Nocardia brevicatena]
MAAGEKAADAVAGPRRFAGRVVEADQDIRFGEGFVAGADVRRSACDTVRTVLAVTGRMGVPG